MGPPGTAGAAGTGADGAAGCCIAAGSRAGQECFDVQQPLGLLLFSLSEVPREHFFTALGDVHSLRPEGGRGYGRCWAEPHASTMLPIWALPAAPCEPFLGELHCHRRGWSRGEAAWLFSTHCEAGPGTPACFSLASVFRGIKIPLKSFSGSLMYSQCGL